MSIERVKRSFSALDNRPEPLGAMTYMGLLPKDLKEKPNFLRYWAPLGSRVASQTFGYLLITEEENFSRPHCDLEETIDNLITLYGAGKKIWLFVNPGEVGRRLEREGVDPGGLMEVLQGDTTSLYHFVQCVGDTVYLPYGCPELCPDCK